MKKMYKLFTVLNFKKTYATHLKRMSKLSERMEELGIDYHDFLDSDAWVTIEAEVYKRIMLGKMSKRSTAKCINYKTRDAIAGTLKFYDLPASYDTAFFIANYMKTIEGMADILQGFIDRGDIK